MNCRKSIKTIAALSFFSVVFRMILSLFLTENKTGFIISEYKVLGTAFAVLSFLFLFTASFFTLFLKVKKGKMPQSSVTLSLFSMFVGIFLIFDILTFKRSEIYPAWEVMLIYLAGFLAAVFFILYSVKLISNINLSSFTYLFPFFFAAVNLVRTFASLSSITIITDNIFCLLANCSAILFLLEFAKAENGFITAKNHRRLRFFGVFCSTVSFSAGFFPILKCIIFPDSILHQNLQPLLITLFIGLFALCFTVSFFNNKNKV